MKFIKYPSLTNHYIARKQSFIDMEDEYVSTEKIHGSNISIIIDNDDNIDVAKRTAFLTELEREQRPWNTLATFADEQKELIIAWTHQVREITQELTNEQIQQVHFYGELYGSKVQQMEYQEALDKVRRIRLFDVHVIFENERRLVFSQDRLTQIFGDEYTAPVLRKGKLKDLILSVEELQSKLGDCGAEGQVYKPVDDYFVQPDRNGKVHYPVVKHKHVNDSSFFYWFFHHNKTSVYTEVKWDVVPNPNCYLNITKSRRYYMVKSTQWYSYNGTPCFILAPYPEFIMLQCADGYQMTIKAHETLTPITEPVFTLGETVLDMNPDSEFYMQSFTVTGIYNNDYYTEYQLDNADWVTPFELISFKY